MTADHMSIRSGVECPIEADDNSRSLRHILAVLAPDVVMMVDAYFDESGTHQGSPVMCVAGYLFDADQVLRFDTEWKDVLEAYNLDHFHAADCAQGVADFKTLTRPQRNDLMISLVGIIVRRARVGIAVSVSETDFGAIAPPHWIKGGPYLLAALQVVGGVVGWAEKQSFSGSISYFFEQGHKHQSLTNEAIEMVKRNGSDHMRYKSHTFAEKKSLRPLQAADLLAYEWQKELRRINLPPDKRCLSMRRSLHRLLEVPHFTQHVGAEQLHVAMTSGHEAVTEIFRRFDSVN